MTRVEVEGRTEQQGSPDGFVGSICATNHVEIHVTHVCEVIILLPSRHACASVGMNVAAAWNAPIGKLCCVCLVAAV